MYLGRMAIESVPLQLVRLQMTKDEDWEMIRRAFEIVWRTFGRTFSAVFNWIVDMAPLCTTETLRTICTFVEAYPHPFHIISWSLFFGPIIVLIPCLLILELLILLVFYSSFIAHGILQGSLDERFYSLKEYFEESRESLFSTVESWTTIFNNWTSKHPALLVLRLVSAVVGLVILTGIWTDWNYGTSIEPAP